MLLKIDTDLYLNTSSVLKLKQIKQVYLSINKHIMTKRLTLEEFIAKARKKHGNTYDYKHVVYKNSKTPVKILCPIHGEFFREPSKHMSGGGCHTCIKILNDKKKTQTPEEFIVKARQKHGDKYNYDNIKSIVNAHTYVTIICPIHGPFPQTPDSHTRGSGCNDCAKIIRANKLLKSTESFKERAKKIHGNKYDYSKVDYTYAKNNVTIICPEHGSFEQPAICHLIGHGCHTCAQIVISNKRRKKIDTFISEAKLKHGKKYDYKNVNYVNSSTYVDIICPIHGAFRQTPEKHLAGGCYKCGFIKSGETQRKSIEQFIQDAKNKHGNKYDYSLVKYEGSFVRVTITCTTHGPFEITPDSHLQGRGCKQCNPSGYSKISIQWLEFMKGYYNIDIKHAENGGEHVIKLDDKKYFCDGYATESNTIFEFNGDFWHGNPKVFERTNLNKITNKSFGELYDYTMEKKQVLRSKGYKYVDVWERDWRNAIKLVTLIQNICRGQKSIIPTSF